MNLLKLGKLDREFVCHAVKGFFAIRWTDTKGRRYASGMSVDASFCGVCIAAPKDHAALLRTVELVRELGVRSLRLDISPVQDLSFVDALVDKLNAHGFKVLLHLIQPMVDAKRMPDADCVIEWRRFVSQTLEHFSGRIEAVEAGTTINRVKWAGYTLEGFIKSWEVVYAEAKRINIPLVGPNVTDFEPQYNAGLLGMLKRRDMLPDVHSNNLFAERAIEPEAVDQKILGERLKGLHGCDLVFKARLIGNVGAAYGVPRAWSTCAFWTLPRIKRLLTDSENKVADYLTRYFVLCAASGAFERIYWGPLVSRREGLLDDSSEDFDLPDRRDIVAYYREMPGESQEWRYRPAFYALQAFNRLLEGARYGQSLCAGSELQIHSFEREDRVVHVCWTMNGKIALPKDCYSKAGLDEVIASYDCNGVLLEWVPSFFGESPCYLEWSAGKAPEVCKGASVLPRVVVAPVYKGDGYYGYEDEEWRGLIRASSPSVAQLLSDTLRPQVIGANPQQANLRKSRNAIWTIEDPRDNGLSLAVKRPERIAWHKQVLDRDKPSKALRSWNGTCELLRRGITSPAPVAYFESKNPDRMLDNWFICEHFTGGHSARSFFMRYASDEGEVEGCPFEEFALRLVRFVQRMHRRRVYFRDLSGGNVLVRITGGGKLTFSLIDTARVRIENRGIGLAERIADLKRLVHKLDPARQEIFMNMYLEASGGRFSALQKASFKLYALKALMKRWKRRLRKSLAGRTAK